MKRKGKSPTQRSMDHWRRSPSVERPSFVWRAERWNSFARKREDAFGFADILVINRLGVIAVQSTTLSNFSARVRKILGKPEAKAWLLSGGRVIVEAWGKRGARGQPKRWGLGSREITLEDFGE